MITLNIEENKQEYIKRFRKALGHRQGAEELLNYIVSPNRDFFTAPASANDVLSIPGGLCKYALLLNETLEEMFSTGVFAKALEMKDEQGKPLVTKEAIAVSSLLSPLDNMLLFSVEQKNRKSYDPQVIARLQASGETVRVDAKGQYVWEAYNGYTYDDSMPLGDGIRAISFIQAFMPLKKEELLAIRWAKGSATSGHDKGAMWNAFNTSILTVAMQNAAMTVRFLLANEQYYDVFNSSNQSNVYSIHQNNIHSEQQPMPVQQTQQVVQSQASQTVNSVATSNSNNPSYSMAPVNSLAPVASTTDEDLILKDLDEFDKIMMGM